MKAIEVRYTVRPEFVEQNKANIRKVMQRLRDEPIDGMFYSSYTLDDGCTFVHINIARDPETLGRLVEVAEFKEFQAALKASQPTSPPSPTPLSPVAAGFEV